MDIKLCILHDHSSVLFTEASCTDYTSLVTCSVPLMHLLIIEIIKHSSPPPPQKETHTKKNSNKKTEPKPYKHCYFG